jgi:hypothetical protein
MLLTYINMFFTYKNMLLAYPDMFLTYNYIYNKQRSQSFFCSDLLCLLVPTLFCRVAQMIAIKI